jgi:crotonobetainyl-CoA:carnitine CoA-transferase CaiB-like acyl-CoA transferase
MTERSGPLLGLKVLEFAHAGPAVVAGGLLAFAGAEVVGVRAADRPEPPDAGGRRSVVLDLDRPAAIEACLRLVERADVLLDGLPPGALEALGLGPEMALARNPGLVYARASGEAPLDAYGLAFGLMAAVLRARETGQGQVVGLMQHGAGPAPRFSVTPGAAQAAASGEHGREILSDWGLEPSEIDSLAAQSAI